MRVETANGTPVGIPAFGPPTPATSGGGGTGEASRRIAAAASETVRQMMGQPNEENWLAPGLIRFPGNLGKA